MRLFLVLFFLFAPLKANAFCGDAEFLKPEQFDAEVDVVFIGQFQNNSQYLKILKSLKGLKSSQKKIKIKGFEKEINLYKTSHSRPYLKIEDNNYLFWAKKLRNEYLRNDFRMCVFVPPAKELLKYYNENHKPLPESETNYYALFGVISFLAFLLLGFLFARTRKK